MKKSITNPFTIIQDTAEQNGWWFTGLAADSDKQYRPLIVNVKREYIGDGLGDYTIEGFKKIVSIERKSMDDLYGTVLGFNGGRRDRFENELSILNAMKTACVIVEGSLATTLRNPPDYGKKPAAHNAKILYRSIISYQQKFERVHWWFCDTRRLAEITAFRVLEKFWNREQEKEVKETANEEWLSAFNGAKFQNDNRYLFENNGL